MSQALADRLRAAKAERDQLQQEATVVADRPRQKVDVEDLMGRYQRLLLQLEEVVSAEADRARTRQILAELLGPVTIGREETGAANADFAEPAERLLIAAVGESPMLVAGARFELATFGL
jgi:site-specific DNA recombinase